MQIVSRAQIAVDVVQVRRTRPTTDAAPRDGLATVPCFGMELLERRMLYAAGDLDTSFDEDGWTITPRPGEHADKANQRVRGVIVEPNGRTVVLSETWDFGQVGLYRYNADGSLDASFGDGGAVFTDVAASSEEPVSITRLNDGKYLVAGEGDEGEGGGVIFLARYNADGSLDASFGDGGIVKENFGLYDSDIVSATVGADGSITIAGSCMTSPHARGESLLLAHFNADGTLDKIRGVDGRIIGTFLTDSWVHVRQVQWDPDGNALVLFGANGVNYVSRHRPDGSMDRSFAQSGFALIGFDDGFSLVDGLVALEDGGFLASGTRNGAGMPTSLAVARFGDDGNVDLSFGDRGVTLIADHVQAFGYVVLQPDGKIVMGGTLIRPAEQHPLDWADFAVARLNSDGTVDTSFGGGDGVVISDLDGFEQVWSIGVGGDGKIILAGNTLGGGMIVARYDGEFAPAPTPQPEPAPELLEPARNQPAAIAAPVDRLLVFGREPDEAVSNAFTLLSAGSSDLIDGETDEDDLLA